MFNDEQIVTTFRFDKLIILYITGIKLKFIRGTIPNFILFCTGLVEDSLPKRYTECEHKLLPVDQVLLALQFFETGTFQSVVANVLVSGLLDVPSMLFPMLSVA